jgi:threonylcarbamoyladenosine tRNA methylthiotransferase MtaB
MERKYLPEQFAEMVAECRTAIPGVTITTDVITGFPGETEQEFEEGLRFISEQRFDGMHVFKYSRRSGTKAAHLPGHVSEHVKAERSRLLREEAVAGVSRLLDRHRGVTAPIAWEVAEDAMWRGLTDTNVRVYASPDETLVAQGEISKRRLTVPFRDGLWSERQETEIPLLPV